MRLLVLSCLVILLSACGKTGALYLPEDKTAEPEEKTANEKAAAPADIVRD